MICFTSYTSTSPHSFLRPCVNEEQVFVGLVSTTTCPAQVVTSSLRESQRHLFQTSYCRLNPSALKTGGNLYVFEACVNLNPGIDTAVVTRTDGKTC